MSAHAEYVLDISASLIVDTDVLIGLSIKVLNETHHHFYLFLAPNSGIVLSCHSRQHLILLR